MCSSDLLEQARGGAYVEEVRRETSSDFTPERFRGEIGKITPAVKKLEAQLAENPEKKEKLEAMLKDTKERIARAEANLALAEKRGVIKPEDVITQVFLRTVSRPPTASEIEKAKTDFAAAKSPAEGARELLWAMLNTREFMVNH